MKALQQQALGITEDWDIRWCASAFLADKLTLYPARSLVRNIGHDGSGIHCGTSSVYDVELAQSMVPFEAPIIHDINSYYAFASFFRSLTLNIVQKNWLSRTFKAIKSSIRVLD